MKAINQLSMSRSSPKSQVEGIEDPKCPPFLISLTNLRTNLLVKLMGLGIMILSLKQVACADNQNGPIQIGIEERNSDLYLGWNEVLSTFKVDNYHGQGMQLLIEKNFPSNAINFLVTNIQQDSVDRVPIQISYYDDGINLQDVSVIPVKVPPEIDSFSLNVGISTNFLDFDASETDELGTITVALEVDNTVFYDEDTVLIPRMMLTFDDKSQGELVTVSPGDIVPMLGYSLSTNFDAEHYKSRFELYPPDGSPEDQAPLADFLESIVLLNDTDNGMLEYPVPQDPQFSFEIIGDNGLNLKKDPLTYTISVITNPDFDQSAYFALSFRENLVLTPPREIMYGLELQDSPPFQGIVTGRHHAGPFLIQNPEIPHR